MTEPQDKPLVIITTRYCPMCGHEMELPENEKDKRPQIWECPNCGRVEAGCWGCPQYIHERRDGKCLDR